MKERTPKKKLGLILFLVIIMVGTSFSFVFYGFAPATQTVKYNGISFSSGNNIWTAKINGQEAAFSFLPADVQDIPAKNDFSKILSGKYEIDTTSEVNSTNKEYIALAEHQMGLTLGSYNIYLSKGFTANNSFNLPVISCSNATQYTPVIYFRHGNSTSISVQDNCVIAEASSNTEFIRVKDRLLYGILGVMG
ncbi:MAG TPA: hypothetical protein VJI52_02600 [Candidatus Nanoarchaeia archaeon]|nr:hypothetical protein [Candidatus Nanoarchaeia archaeon]